MNINGDWYLPNGEKHTGELINDDVKGRLSLVLYTDKYIEGVLIEKNFRNTAILFHKVILSDFCTLYNCKFVRGEKLGDRLYKIHYEAEFMFRNIKIESPDEFKISTATFMYSDLSTWFDGSTSLYKLEGKGGYMLTERKLSKIC